MSCEGDLVAEDLSADGTSSHTLERVAGNLDSTSLFQFIDLRQSYALNLASAETLPLILRPHNERDDISNDKSITNLDEEDGLIVTIQFTELVRLKAMLLSCGTGEERPRYVKVWANRPDGMAFSDVEDQKVDQDFDLLDERGCVEYPMRIARFSSVSSVSIYLPLQTPNPSLRVFYLGFKGASRVYKKEPGEQLTVAAENAASHLVDSVKERSTAASQTTAR